MDDGIFIGEVGHGRTEEAVVGVQFCPGFCTIDGLGVIIGLISLLNLPLFDSLASLS